MKKHTRLVAEVFLLLLVLAFLQALFMPKYTGDILEGGLIETYYEEDLAHNVLFVGDCEVYENFSPVTLWEEEGLTSFIRGSAQQLIWQSYYLLEEALERETPDVVVFNVLSMKYNTPQKEAYNRMTLDGMAWSTSKWRAIEASMMEDEHLIEYVFPLLRYHSRWTEVGVDDFRYLLERPRQFHNGYMMQVGIKPLIQPPRVRPLPDYQLGERAMAYLDKMRILTEKKGVDLVLIKAPTIYPHWYEEWDAQIEDYAKEHGLLYVNFLDEKHMEAAGIDLTVDTYDAGLHLNVFGAEKLTRYFGKMLVERFSFTPFDEEEGYQRAWEEKASFYHGMKEEMIAKREEEKNAKGEEDDTSGRP